MALLSLLYEYCLSEGQNFACLISKFLLTSVVLSFTVLTCHCKTQNNACEEKFRNQASETLSFNYDGGNVHGLILFLRIKGVYDD